MGGLYTEVRGSGPTLVLLHGWALNLRVWDGLAAALSDRFRIVAVDLPGHGRSGWLPDRSSLEEQAAQVRETVSSIAEEYSLLGWSLGGQIALQIACAERRDTHASQRGTHAEQRSAKPARRPSAGHSGSDRVGLDRLVLIAATPRLSAASDWPHGAPPDRLAQQAIDLRTDYRRTVSDFLELQVRGSADGAAALEQLRAALFAHGDAAREDVAHADSPSLAALARGLELLRDTDLRPILGDITVPTLVVAGQYDRVTMPAASRALADALPDARYVEIRRAAHAPFLSHLPQLVALLEKFLLPA
jgi:pimeloyl-[acyl-carrier protein] methyl ester esterase